jgi:tRNA pseudouridine32 synthase/23S rRNA pseudouridine746 synthase
VSEYKSTTKKANDDILNKKEALKIGKKERKKRREFAISKLSATECNF